MLRRLKFFVYGTLKRGYGNHYLLEESDFLGEAYTYKKFLLWDCGFPYAVPSQEGESIKGELYRVSYSTLKRLDALEGFPYHYKRQRISCLLKTDRWECIEKCFIYYTFRPAGEKIVKKFFDEKLLLKYFEWF